MGSNPCRRATVAVAQKMIGVEKELGNGAIGAGIDLALQIVEIGAGTSCFGMASRMIRISQKAAVCRISRI